MEVVNDVKQRTRVLCFEDEEGACKCFKKFPKFYKRDMHLEKYVTTIVHIQVHYVQFV